MSGGTRDGRLAPLKLLMTIACAPQSEPSISEAAPQTETIQSARSSVVLKYNQQRPCPEPTAFAGKWKIGALTHGRAHEPTTFAYEIDIELKHVKYSEQAWVRVEGAEPRSSRMFVGTATWDLNCKWIGVDSMTLRSAQGDSVDIAFLFSLEDDGLRGWFAVYQDPHRARHAYELASQGGAAAEREHTPELSKSFEGFPCELACRLRHGALVASAHDIEWDDNDDVRDCIEQNKCPREPVWVAPEEDDGAEADENVVDETEADETQTHETREM